MLSFGDNQSSSVQIGEIEVALSDKNGGSGKSTGAGGLLLPLRIHQDDETSETINDEYTVQHFVSNDKRTMRKNEDNKEDFEEWHR